MPCISDYPTPSTHQTFLRKTAQLYVYALGFLGRKVPSKVRKAADTEFCNDDFVPHLCGLLRALEIKSGSQTKSASDLDALVYNARSKDSRELATWWEEHQAADEERVKREAEAAKTTETRRKALEKLTVKEAKALDLELSTEEHTYLIKKKGSK